MKKDELPQSSLQTIKFQEHYHGRPNKEPPPDSEPSLILVLYLVQILLLEFRPKHFVLLEPQLLFRVL